MKFITKNSLYLTKGWVAQWLRPLVGEGEVMCSKPTGRKVWGSSSSWILNKLTLIIKKELSLL